MGRPESIVIIRHGKSESNASILRMKKDLVYKQFLAAYDSDWCSSQTLTLAFAVKQKFFSKAGQHYTPLTKEGKKQAKKIGARLKGKMAIPDAVITSPSPRTKDTFEWMKKGWPELAGVEEVCHDERIREQGHGLISVYSDLKVMFAIHREQRQLCDAEGQYFYKFPGGEDMPDVNLRVGLFLRDVDERFAGKRVMIISHFRTILSLRAMLEHLSPEDFNEITTHDGPINCGVTRYERESVQNEDGKLVLARYNEKLYD